MLRAPNPGRAKDSLAPSPRSPMASPMCTRCRLQRRLYPISDRKISTRLLIERVSQICIENVLSRAVANLLNPCHCKTTGICRCCEQKRERNTSVGRHSSPSRSTSTGEHTPSGNHSTLTDGFIEMFQSKASTHTGDPADAVPPTPRSGPTWAQLMMADESYISPEHKHHPAHTSPHVHKTKLYSPYNPPGHVTPRHGYRRETDDPSAITPAGWASAATPRPPLPRLKPIADMSSFLGAVFREDGSVSTEIPRSALGLPAIKTFDTAAERGGVKVESMEMEVDAPISFPTQEDVVIAACTCGDTCDCPGCAIHARPSTSTDHHAHEGSCGDSCKSCFDCADHLSLPRGITSIDHLLSIAAAHVPPPARNYPLDLSSKSLDTQIAPPSAQLSDDAARSHGIVTLKPLECCNGRCQCAPGNCSCEKDCCGCCIRCACEEGSDTTARPDDATGSCCQPSTSQTTSQIGTIAPQGALESSISPPIVSPRPVIATTNSTSFLTTGQNVSRPTSSLSHNEPLPGSENPDTALIDSNAQTLPGPSLLRRASTSHHHELHGSHPTTSHATPLLNRRATLGSRSHGTNTPVHRSASSGKSASKALALHTTPNHAHAPHHAGAVKAHQGHHSHLGPHKSGLASSNGSQHSSPALQPQSGNGQLPVKTISLPGAAVPPPLPSQNPQRTNTLGGFSSDSELMAYIEALTNGSGKAPVLSPSNNTPPQYPDSYQIESTPTQPVSQTKMPDGTQVDQQEVYDMLARLMNIPGQQQPPQQNQDIPPNVYDKNVTQTSPYDADPLQAPLDPTILQYLYVNQLTESPENNYQAPPFFPTYRTPSEGGSNRFPSPPNNLSNDVGLPSTTIDLLLANLPKQPNSGTTSLSQLPSSLPPLSTAALSLSNLNLLPSNGRSNMTSNMIDLSKPLSAVDVERILSALQRQQGSSPPQATSQPESHAEPTYSQTMMPLSVVNRDLNHQDNSTSSEPSLASNDDDLFSKFVFDPALLRDANGDAESDVLSDLNDHLPDNMGMAQSDAYQPSLNPYYGSPPPDASSTAQGDLVMKIRQQAWSM